MQSKSIRLHALSFAFFGLAAVVAAGAVLPLPAEWERRQTTPETGGLASTARTNPSAFATPITGITAAQRRTFAVGDHLFNTNWVAAPGSVGTKDGLGPLFNRVSCAGCHLRDGRGRPPVEGEEALLSELIRLSVPGRDAHGGPLPHPVYGGQLQEYGVLGVPKEGRTRITWTEAPGSFGDGTPYSLRVPAYEITELGYGPLGDDVLFSPRVAPSVFGSGLIEGISEEQILAHADPEDADGDGVSGRPNQVWDEEAGRQRLGRYGWKANQPGLRQQAAAAFNGDIGISTPLFPGANATEVQREAMQAAQLGEQPEVDEASLDKVTTYLTMLSVPQRRSMDEPAVQQGEEAFYRAQCAACHQPTYVTGRNDEIPQLAGQRIHPYSDFLIHDMGEGLADGRPDFEADGREWRTPPLWGIGLQKVVNGHTFYLHDGRARNLVEAILWHGGEAQASREAFLAMSAEQRAALIAFLDSL